ncbi:hypothetical protein SAMN06295912_102223 [Sphingomonas laterariae]|uniref:Uncharacterized protein n=1 Tax=Edaphosphingomonas laterariae TaxID=861865 RepID=A0A239CHN7_9SPHN|nr:DUF6515 family protein [Sphingomonas laterariae]SNS19766.1 hypothetical protein SAMN06295912_102223 [Sphingomonas laterariae]
MKMGRSLLAAGATLALVTSGILASAAEGRGARMGIHPGMGGRGGAMRPPHGGGAGAGIHDLNRRGDVGWDRASHGPPRPGPDPRPPRPGPDPRPPGPGPGPGPHPRPPGPPPRPLPPPPPPPAWGWGPYWDWYDNDDDFAVGMAVGAVTGAVVGSAAASSSSTTVVVAPAVGTVVVTLPAGCSAVMIGNITYQQCGSAWYRPQYVGTSLQYVVVAPPR